MPEIGAGAVMGSGSGRPDPLPILVFPPCEPPFTDAAAASHPESGIFRRCFQARCTILTHPLQNNSLSFGWACWKRGTNGSCSAMLYFSIGLNTLFPQVLVSQTIAVLLVPPQATSLPSVEKRMDMMVM